jgi:hypothetical protein
MFVFKPLPSNQLSALCPLPRVLASPRPSLPAVRAPSIFAASAFFVAPQFYDFGPGFFLFFNVGAASAVFTAPAFETGSAVETTPSIPAESSFRNMVGIRKLPQIEA